MRSAVSSPVWSHHRIVLSSVRFHYPCGLVTRNSYHPSSVSVQPSEQYIIAWVSYNSGYKNVLSPNPVVLGVTGVVLQ